MPLDDSRSGNYNLISKCDTNRPTITSRHPRSEPKRLAYTVQCGLMLFFCRRRCVHKWTDTYEKIIFRSYWSWDAYKAVQRPIYTPVFKCCTYIYTHAYTYIYTCTHTVYVDTCLHTDRETICRQTSKQTYPHATFNSKCSL